MNALERAGGTRTSQAAAFWVTALLVTVLSPEARAQDQPQAEEPAPEPVALPPDWLRSMERLHFYGDFRLRQEADRHLDGSDDRNRTRIRARLGANYEVNDQLLFGARLVTGDPDDARSTNQTLGNGFDDFDVSLDRAFLRYRPTALEGTTLVAGKFASPFWTNPVYPELVWDGDVQPEGFAITHDSSFAGMDAVNSTFGTYIVQEESGADDVYAFVAQVHGRKELSEGTRGDLAVGYYNYTDLTPNGETDLVSDNHGNAVIDDTGDGVPDEYVSDYGILNPIASVTFEGEKPLVFSGEYIKNYRAHIPRDEGWAVGVAKGKIAKKGDWRVYYQFQDIEQDSVFSPFAQDDFLLTTNAKTHLAGVQYALTDKVNLHLWTMVSARDDTSPGPTTNSGQDQWRVKFDLNVKF